MTHSREKNNFMHTPPSGEVRELVIWEGITMAIHEECGVIGVYDPSRDCARRPAWQAAKAMAVVKWVLSA